MVHTQSKHTQLTKTRAVNIQITPNRHLVASRDLWRWLYWLREGALLDVRRRDKRDKNAVQIEGTRTAQARPPGAHSMALSTLKGLSC